MVRKFRKSLLVVLLGCIGSTAMAQSPVEELFIRKEYVEARDFAARSSSLDDLSILGWSQFMLDDFGAAEQSFRKLEKSWPNDFDVKLGIAWVSIKTGKFDDAGRYLKEAEPLALGWQGFMVEDAKGWLALKKGDYAAAEGHFKRELGMPSASSKADPNVGLGWLAFHRGDLTKAKAAFTEGTERDRKCFFCRDGLARIALIKNDGREALKQVLDGIRITADNGGLNSLLGAALAAIGDPALSVKTYQDMIRQHPKSLAFKAGLGFSLLAAGKPGEAEVEFKNVLKSDPGNSAALAGMGSLQVYKTEMVKDGWTAYYKNDFEAALKLFDGKLADAARKKNPSAADGRGWTLLALDKPGEAREAFRQAIALDPDFFYSRSGLTVAEGQLLTTYRRAWALVDLQRLDEASALFEKARATTPADLQWLIQDGLAWISFHKKDYEAAEKAFSAILAANPGAYLSQNGLGRVALQRKDFAKAGRLIAQSLQQNPYQILSSYTSAAQSLIDAGQYKDAREILTLGERIYPYSADIHFLMARARAGLNDDGDAGLSLARASELAPAYIEPKFDNVRIAVNGRQPALLSLAWGLYYAGSYEEAAKRFQQYSAAGGSAVSGITGLGWAQLARKKLPEAAQAFQAAVQKGDKGEANAGLGWTALARNDNANAEKNFKLALKAVPNLASAQSGLASIQLQKTAVVKDAWEAYYKGDYKKALDLFQWKASAAAAAGNPAAEDGRGWALLALGDTKAAASAFAAALKIDPDHLSSQSGQVAVRRADLVSYQQAWVKLEAGQFAEAKAKFDQARAESPQESRWLIDDGLAWIAFYRKDYDAAEKAFKAVIAATPGAYLSHKGLGYVLIERKQYAGAAKELVASYSLAPYQGVLAFTAPTLKMIDAGAFADAREVLQVGERAYPYSADIQYLLARAYAGLRDEARAGKKAAAAAALAPLAIDPVFDKLKLPPAAAREGLANLGWGFYFAGDHVKALKRFGEAAKAGATDPNVGRGTAFALFRQGKYKEAIPLLEAAIRHEPKPLLPIVETVPIPGTKQYWTIEYTAGTTLAWAHYRLGDGARADKLFAEALGVNPFGIDSLTGRGYARLALKDGAGARNYFEQALKISPSYPDARQGLEAAKKL
jgi:tetratricopeptide (TPR) repeat protein